MNILITGSKGFIAKNLIVKLKSSKKYKTRFDGLLKSIKGQKSDLRP